MKAEIELEKKNAQKALERTKLHYDENRDKQAKENIISYLQSPDNWEDGNAVLISVLAQLRDTPAGVTMDEVDEEHLNVLAVSRFLQEEIEVIDKAESDVLNEKSNAGIVEYINKLKAKVGDNPRGSAIIASLDTLIDWLHF